MAPAVVEKKYVKLMKAIDNNNNNSTFRDYFLSITWIRLKTLYQYPEGWKTTVFGFGYFHGGWFNKKG